MNEKLSRNIPLIWLFKFLKGFMFFLPIYALYLQQELFTVFNVSLIISIGALSVVIFEVPSGSIADLFGRKKTLILSSILAIIALVFLAMGGDIIFFIIYAIINALSESLISGTDVAMMFDTLKANSSSKKIARAIAEVSPKRLLKWIPEGIRNPTFKKAIGINNSMWPLGASIGAIIGGILASYSLRLPVLVTIIPFMFAMLVTLFLIEPPYEKEKHKDIFLHMFKSTKLILGNKQVLILMLTGLLFHSFGEVSHQLKPIFFAFKGISVEYFGLFFAATFAFSFIGALLSQKVSDKFGNKNALIMTVILSATIGLLATLVFGLTAGVLIALTSIFWAIRWPIVTYLLNLEVSSKNRATVLSLGNFSNSLGLAVAAPFFGYLVDVFNINIVYQLTEGLALLTIFLLLFIKDKN